MVFGFSPIIYVSLFSYVQIPESQPYWIRAADSVYHLFNLVSDVNSCLSSFPWYIVGRNWDCISF